MNYKKLEQKISEEIKIANKCAKLGETEAMLDSLEKAKEYSMYIGKNTSKEIKKISHEGYFNGVTVDLASAKNLSENDSDCTIYILDIAQQKADKIKRDITGEISVILNYMKTNKKQKLNTKEIFNIKQIKTEKLNFDIIKKNQEKQYIKTENDANTIYLN